MSVESMAANRRLLEPDEYALEREEHIQEQERLAELRRSAARVRPTSSFESKKEVESKKEEAAEPDPDPEPNTRAGVGRRSARRPFVVGEVMAAARVRPLVARREPTLEQLVVAAFVLILAQELTHETR